MLAMGPNKIADTKGIQDVCAKTIEKNAQGDYEQRCAEEDCWEINQNSWTKGIQHKNDILKKVRMRNGP